MSWFVDVFSGKTITAIACASSIASLLLTFVVFLGVRKIRKFYIFTARVPELNQRLSDIASKISSQLNGNSLESTVVTETMADAEVTLKSLSRKVGNPLKPQAKKIIKEIRLLDKREGILAVLFSSRDNGQQNTANSREERLRRIYIALYKLNAECKEIYEDARWEQ